jgi:biuret amidohydrolase
VSIPIEVQDRIAVTNCALLCIDMQRRHLDPEVGYHLVGPEFAAAILDPSRRVLDAARRLRVPVVHVITYSRRPSPWGFTDHRNPFWEYQTGKIIPGMGKPRQTGKNVEGSAYAEVMPDLAPRSDEPVVVKKRYSGFYATDLELLLRGLRVETLFLIGVNTNNCVLATAFDAFSRDFRIVVLADCCGSMNGVEYHHFALKEIEAALGFVSSSDEATALLGRAASPAVAGSQG